jgi:hypothetical protein
MSVGFLLALEYSSGVALVLLVASKYEQYVYDPPPDAMCVHFPQLSKVNEATGHHSTRVSQLLQHRS